MQRSRGGLRLEEVAEADEEETGEHHGDGQREDPSQEQVANGGHLQAGGVSKHDVGYTGREHVGSADRWT